LDPQAAAKMSKARIVVDTVNALVPSNWTAAGFDLYRLGVGTLDD